jgi:transcriptional regulator with XRE-family HTH domain
MISNYGVREHHPMQPELIYKNIGKIVRSKRRLMEWTQTTLAQRLGISRATLANIETGRQRILVHQLYSFAAALDMKTEELLPPQQSSSLDENWAHLPMPDDLKPQQREQIARLIDAVDKPFTDGKNK